MVVLTDDPDGRGVLDDGDELARADPTEQVRIGTSISVGYMAENFADFGFPGMLLGVAQFAVDDSLPVHRVTYALEEARLSFELMLQVRNRLLEGTQQLLNMQL